MRTLRAVCLAAAYLAADSLQPAFGQTACTPDAGKLGVSRTAVIDTQAGPRFGVQYKDASFLADGEVVLTFDDGPSRAYTKPILDALAAHCTRATFFMVGRMALADPQMVKEVANQGHTIATHTWSHANLYQIAPSQAEAEIELGISAVRHALGKPITPFFRYPYLRDTKGTLGHLVDRHLAVFSIDVDSKDYLTTSAAAVIGRVLGGLATKRKGIILLHDIHASTARAMPTLLNELKARGFKVVHIRPKADVQTVAEYDDRLQQQADRTRMAGDRRPLAKRTLTWPTTVLTQSQPEQVPPPRPAPRAQPADDWMSNIFRW
ncbi:MAG: polysaccharide deacetylase family protein [Hyphomonadaceae bacterium]|jgi:peptidoglycan/xylan/chitin deacetylase (PgdA/CDA1 family)|nr:polysaccharide deacetylase family protein [Hyphomonadaceae bacterium]